MLKTKNLKIPVQVEPELELVWSSLVFADESID